jgi:hypothetical protein
VVLRSTSNLLAGARLRTATGRDHPDVPPTKGIFKGAAASDLAFSVRVSPSDAPPAPDPNERRHRDVRPIYAYITQSPPTLTVQRKRPI